MRFKEPNTRSYALLPEPHKTNEAIDFVCGHQAFLNTSTLDSTDEHSPRRVCLACMCYALVIVLLVTVNLTFKTVNEPTPREELRDAAGHLFPSVSSSLPSAMHIEGRDDIRSFAFDLGGSTCACLLQWDTRQYWQRVFYGTKYVAFHCTTAFFGAFCLHRPQWVVLYKVTNEVLEELGLVLDRRWAWAKSVLDLEARYDTLVNDLLLALVPFSALGLHLVTVLGLPDPLPHPASMHKTFLLPLLCIFLQFYMFNQANDTSGVFAPSEEQSLAGVTWRIGKLVAGLLQIGLIWLLQGCKMFWLPPACKLSWNSAWVTTVVVVAIWAPFVVHPTGDDEQITAMLSFALAGFCVCAYQLYTGTHHKILFIALPCYVGVFVIFCTFGKIVDPPSDRFYYHHNWCGLSDSRVTSSCSAAKFTDGSPTDGSPGAH